jgi:hypothetical protein
MVAATLHQRFRPDGLIQSGSSKIFCDFSEPKVAASSSAPAARLTLLQNEENEMKLGTLFANAPIQALQ